MSWMILVVTLMSDPNEALWTAARKGNAAKVSRLLQEGVSADGRVVALSVSVSNNRPESFTVLWKHDNSDVAPAALDYALCYAYRNPTPAAEIAEVVHARSLTVDSCCNRNQKQPYCARRPIRLTSQEYPPTQCTTVFVDSAEVPAGATRIAVVWDERISVLDPASSAKYGTPKISPSGSRAWAMEFAPALGQLGADAILISSAETIEAAQSSLTHYPKGDLSGFKYGAVIDRIELVAIRTSRPE
jgi:hypothetical protein